MRGSAGARAGAQGYWALGPPLALNITLVLGGVYCGWIGSDGVCKRWNDCGLGSGHCQAFYNLCFTFLFRFISSYI